MFFLIPYGHERQTVQRLPIVTFGLIALNLVIFLFTNFFGQPDEAQLQTRFDTFYKYLTTHPYLQIPDTMHQFLSPEDEKNFEVLREGATSGSLTPERRKQEQSELDDRAAQVMELINDDALRKYGYTPADSHYLNLITSLFLHAGWWHLIGNMLFLFLAGCPIEDLWGRPIYLSFYLISGVVAAGMHVLKFPNSTAPLIGASGAIAGLMGAFAYRLYKTRISFFYFVWFFGFKWGTFWAPAFIVIPLWFLQQLMYASLSPESGVAFWAHIGGFLFGVSIAAILQTSRVEEKFVAPAIEKKISLVQDPDFLKAMDLSEKSDYPAALILLERAVRRDSHHIDALMEMQRISELTGDKEGYTKYTGLLLDNLLRSHESASVAETYRQHHEHKLTSILPARTLWGLAGWYEEERDYANAAQQLETLTSTYKDDPLALKAWSKLGRLLMDKLKQPDKGKAALAAAYNHSQATEEWRRVLGPELEKRGIDPTQPPKLETPAPEPIPTPKWELRPCKIAQITDEHLVLMDSQSLPLNSIGWVSVGRIRDKNERPGRADYLVIDLVLKNSDAGSDFADYRTFSYQLAFNSIFPGATQSPQEAYQALIRRILYAGAVPLPDPEKVVGPIFAGYAELSEYESALKRYVESSTV